MNTSSLAPLAGRIEERVEDTLDGVRRAAAEAAADTQRALGAAAASVAEAAQALSEQTRARGREAARFTARGAREHPVAATAVGLSLLAAVGLLVAGLARRR